MSYLIFIVAVGLFALLGAGGPLHSDRWFHGLSRRIDAVELDLWPSLALRVGSPVLAGLIALWILEAFLGGLAEALIGTMLLYFAWGRGDYPTELQRFLARARVSDEEGAGMLLSETDDTSGALGRRAMRDFSYRGFARWFPPVMYFWLLGPFGAVAYRLVALANEHSTGRFEAAQRMLDWLPARLLLLTFSVLGDFEHSRRLLTKEALDSDISAQTLLARGIESAWRLDEKDMRDSESVVTSLQTAQKAINRATGVWVVVASVLALI